MQPAPAELTRDAEWFSAALAAGASDACLRQLRREAAAGAVDAALNCRLAEALLPAGRKDEAVECCRRAWPLAGDDPALLRVCAWVFSNARCHEEAAAAYRRLVELCPDWIAGRRHLSGALAEAGHIEEAIAAALPASEAAPDDAEYALHAGALLAVAERREEAARYLGRAAALAGGSGDGRVVADAAEWLLRCGQADAAAVLLDGLSDSAAADPRLFRILSAAEMVRGRLDAALSAIERSLVGAPDNAEYHLHHAHLLWQRGDMEGAGLALGRAAALDPADRDVKRAQMSLYLAAGLATEATAAGGDLLRRFPDDRPAAEAVLHLLNHRLDTIDGEYVVLREGGGRAPRPRCARPGFFDRLRSQRRVIRALIVRETRTRFAEFRLGYGWALLEPVLHIALLSAMFAVLMHGRPPIGRHFFLFYYTGLIPYHMFVHTSGGMSHAITGNAPLLQLPPVTPFDAIAARGLLEVMTDVIVAAIVFAAFAAFGAASMPDDLLGPALALAVTAVFGCGVGFVNAVMSVFWRSWEKVYTQLTRVLYFISGIFYVPAMMPDWARHTLAWNPLLQAIDWFRAGFFAGYQPHWLDRPYLVVLATLALLAGLALQRGLRRRLSTAR